MDQTKRAEFIRELRREKNLTQTALAEKIGVSDRAVSKWGFDYVAPYDLKEELVQTAIVEHFSSYDKDKLSLASVHLLDLYLEDDEYVASVEVLKKSYLVGEASLILKEESLLPYKIVLKEFKNELAVIKEVCPCDQNYEDDLEASLIKGVLDI